VTSSAAVWLLPTRDAPVVQFTKRARETFKRSLDITFSRSMATGNKMQMVLRRVNSISTSISSRLGRQLMASLQ